MSVIGDALLYENAPPIRAIYVYNSNPVAVAPESARSRRASPARTSSCVVHEIFRTDTADYADILLPATTQLEQVDVHIVVRPPLRAREQSVDRAAWRGQAQYRGVPLAGREDGVCRALLSRHRRRVARQAFLSTHPRAAGISWDELKERDFSACRCRRRMRLRRRRLSHAVRQMRVLLRGTGARGPRPAAHVRSAARIGREQSGARQTVSAGVHLRRRLATSSIRRLRTCRLSLPRKRRRGSSSIRKMPPRAIATGDRVRIFNDREASAATARVSERARRGVVVAPSIWWKKLSPDGANANAVTSQALTDLGRAATFYDCLVEVERL